MNFEKFRRTGELSDITVIVDKTEFKLHTFPLFTKSDYFKKAVASTSAPYIIRLDNNFPAACFIECDTLATLLDERFDKILLVARAKYDLGIPLVLLEQCVGEYEQWAKQAHIVDKCLQSIIESLTRTTGLQLNKSDREIIIRLPLQWIIELIKLCPTENKLAILPFVKHYITVHVLNQNQSHNSSTENENEQQASAFTPITKKEDLPITTDDEKRIILNDIVANLGNVLEQFPLPWLNSVYEKSVELRCECQSILSSYITQTILNSSDLDENMENISDDVMARLLERINKHKENINDPQLLTKLSSLIDTYVEQLSQRGTLTSEQFVKLATCIPKEQRNSHDSLLLALDNILKDEKSTQLSSNEREELLSQIDFSRVNEETIAACKNNKLIPQQLITDAALALCVKLRNQLEETRARLRLVESELAKSRPTYTSSNYRSRHYDTSSRIPTRSRIAYTTTSYDLPITSSSYNYSKYDDDTDFDHVLSSKYASSSLNNRYGTYSSYYY